MDLCWALGLGWRMWVVHQAELPPMANDKAGQLSKELPDWVLVPHRPLANCRSRSLAPREGEGGRAELAQHIRHCANRRDRNARAVHLAHKSTPVARPSSKQSTWFQALRMNRFPACSRARSTRARQEDHDIGEPDQRVASAAIELSHRWRKRREAHAGLLISTGRLQLLIYCDGDTRFAGSSCPTPSSTICHVKVETARDAAARARPTSATCGGRWRALVAGMPVSSARARARSRRAAHGRPSGVIMPPVAGAGGRVVGPRPRALTVEDKLVRHRRRARSSTEPGIGHLDRIVGQGFRL